MAAGAGRAAAAAAARAGGIPVRLPAAGLIRLPAPNEIGWLAGMALLAGIGILDWPVAVVLAAGHLLSLDAPICCGCFGEFACAA